MAYDFFEPTQEIDKYINEKEFDALRWILVGIINRDPTFATKRYEEALHYISEKVDIWEPFLKKLPDEYELGQDKWDKEYFRMQLDWLYQNFTHERAKLVEEIGKHVYANENTWGKQAAENFYQPITQKKSTRKCQSEIGRWIMALFIIMIVVAEVVLLMTEWMLVSKVIAVVIGGIAIMCIIATIRKKKL